MPKALYNNIKKSSINSIYKIIKSENLQIFHYKNITNNKYACLNKKVLKFNLKRLKDFFWRREFGKLFQIFGPGTDNAQSPYVTVFVLGTSTKSCEDSLNILYT